MKLRLVEMPRKAIAASPTKKPTKPKRKTESDDEDQMEDEGPSVDQPIEVKEEKGFISFFRGLEHDPKLIRMFDRKGFFSAHGDDALFIANEFHNSLKGIRYWGESRGSPISKRKKIEADGKNSTAEGEPLAYLYIRDGMEFVSLLKFLLFKKSCKIEIWANVAHTSKWYASKKGSPGNITALEEWLDDEEMRDNISTMAVTIGTIKDSKTVGISIIDTTRRSLTISEFPDDERLSNFESAAVQAGVKECRVADGVPYFSQVKEIIEKAGISLIPVKKSDFSLKEGELQQDLERLLKDSAQVSTTHMPYAMSATACLYRTFELLADDTNEKSYSLNHFNFREYLRLDSAAISALHLFPDSAGVSRTGSIFGLLDQCKTAMGSRCLNSWIRLPLKDVSRIVERQDLVSIFIEEPKILSQLTKDYLKHIPDLDRIAKKLIIKKATLRDVYLFFAFSRKLPEIKEVLQGYEGDLQDLLAGKFISPIGELIVNLEKFIELIETTMDVDLAEREHEYVIQPSFDDDLSSISQERDKIIKDMDSCWTKAAKDLGVVKDKSLKFEKNKQYGYFFRLSSKESKVIDKNKDYTAIDNIRKDGVKFRNSKLMSLNSRILEITEQYREKQSELVQRLLEAVATYLPVIEECSSIFAELDVILSFAAVSSQSKTPYVRPVMTPMGTGDIILKDSRHPCVEAQENSEFIPNDVTMTRDSSRFLIITGPNMGGKSTYIRQIGVIVIMAQIGCYVPCSQATLTIVDSVMTRIGANDSQLRGISTFMSEMLETAAILKTATKNSLIIIDELGRGTSTADGLGLAWAICE
eukprot:TRINITY_DN1054_c1_g1_i2.p1 TRINITY_DN1054_c1_g1~~TRINITY_DN1054_c1_g1_i2.p1  ORF type:complete len:813 (-),score=306.49 TRINITY_DN1054_c1_g1_i2:95-2533(-)